MSNIAVVIQARTNSSRFPFKVTKELGDSTVLGQVIKRCLSTDLQVIVAVPYDDKDLRYIASLMGAESFGGSEHDVLGRYYECAKKFRLDYIVRVTSDCPLCDPEIIKQVADVLVKNSQYDFVSNVGKRTWPKGLDVEAFTFESLAVVNSWHGEAFEREHVTPAIVNGPFAKANIRCPIPFLGEMNWCIDYPDDLKFIRAIYAKTSSTNWRDVLSVLDRHPEIQRAAA